MLQNAPTARFAAVSGQQVFYRKEWFKNYEGRKKQSKQRKKGIGVDAFSEEFSYDLISASDRFNHVCF